MSKSLLKFILFTLLLSLAYVPLLAQPVEAKFTGQLGLPHNTVLAISKDAQGNYWFATTNGLAELSGTNWTYYSKSDGFPAKAVYDIALTADGMLWFATDQGLIQRKDGVFKTFGKASGLKFKTVYRLYLLDDDLWLSTDNGFYVRHQDDAWDQLLENERDPWLTQGLGLAKSLDGRIWAGNLNLLSIRDKDNWKDYKAPAGFPIQITSLLPSSGGGIWIGTNQGLAWLDPQADHWNFITGDAAPSGVYVYNLTTDPNGGFWASTNDGAYFFIPSKGWQRFSTLNGLASNNVYKVMVEADGTKWFATDQGASRLIGQTPFTFTEKKFLRDIDDLAWAKPYIRSLYLRGVTSGFIDQTFRPFNQITRAEVLKMVLLSAGKQAELEAEPLALPEELKDVDAKSWQAPFISYAIKNEIMAPRVAGYFHPDLPATRINTLEAIMIAFRITPVETMESRFTDVSPTEAPYAETAVLFGLANGRTPTTFAPNDQITRAEFAKILASAIELKEV